MENRKLSQFHADSGAKKEDLRMKLPKTENTPKNEHFSISLAEFVITKMIVTAKTGSFG